MSNDYFSHSSEISRHTLARSTAMNTLFSAIEAAFDKLPSEESFGKGTVNYAEDTGVANTYEVALPKTQTFYNDGLFVRMRASNTSTGSSTLNVDGLGPRIIRRYDGSVIEENDIFIGLVFDFVYSGGFFWMLTPARSHMVGMASNLGADLDFSGNPIFSGNPEFTGSPDFSGVQNAAAIRAALGVTGSSDIVEDLEALGPPTTDGQIIVATGAGAFAYETGATARASLGAQAQSSVLDNTTASFTTAKDTKLGYLTVTEAIDLDTLKSDVDAISSAMVFKGDWDASSGSFPGGGAAQTGWFYYVATGGTVDGVSFSAGDNIVATTDNASTTTYSSNWSKQEQTNAVSSVVGLTGSITKAGLIAALGGTGADGDVVTGTAGTDGRLVSWNSDGDVVDSGVAASGVATKTGSETLTNKTLTSPVINLGSDASGDTYYRDGGGAFQRLAKGSDGQVMTLASGLPSWEDLPSDSWTKATPVATTSDTYKDYTSLPSGISEIKVLFDRVSLNGGSDLLLQIGTGGSPTTSGYISGSSGGGDTNGFQMKLSNLAYQFSGAMDLYNFSGNIWVSEYSGGRSTQSGDAGGGRVELAGTLDMLRLTNTNGSHEFTLGQFTIWYK